MATHRPKGPPSASIIQSSDANSLFEKHTIEEIRSLEKKTRSDIEKKKEDLRVMVGERYRDLIDAADTITDMKTSAENVMKSITRMEDLCNSLRQKHMVQGASFHMHIKSDGDKNNKEIEFYGIAAQIKLLMDIPEKIWSSIDSQEYLKATQLYLLARHINTSLHMDSRQSADVVKWFPLLTRQWAAISHFKTTILQGCRLLLTDTETDLSDDQMAHVLCSIVLLEDNTPRQVFTEFLLARTKTLQQILHSGHQSNVKSQILGVARLLTSTLRQIYSVFYSHDSLQPGKSQKDNGLLMNILNSVVSNPSQDNLMLDLQGTIFSKCLPQFVKNFKPMLRTPATSLQTKQLKENCQQWIDVCLQDVQSGVGKLLNYVNTVKRLADIRDEVWSLLTQVQSDSCWKEISENILTLRVWENFLRPLFVDRVKALVQYQLDTTAELTRRTVSKVMMELASDINDSSMQFERNLAVFVWTESPADVIMSDIWQAASSKTLTDSGGLILKARAFTPAVQNLCRSVDDKLRVLLEDIETYVQEEEGKKEQQVQGAFHRFSDTADVLKYMQGACIKCVQEILDYLTEQLRLWEKSLADIPDPVTNAITESKVLLTGRTCAAMSEMTPHLQRCVLALPDKNKQTSIKSTKKLHSQKSSELPEWHSVHIKLEQCQMLAYRIWTSYTANQMIQHFSKNISSTDPDAILSQSTRWDEIDIMEETEEGRKLSSKIYVPMQASWHIQTLLYKLCEDLNKIGIQALPRSVVRDLLVMVTDGIVSSYEKLLETRGRKRNNSLSQHEVLQELFNFKFIQLIIPRKEEEEIHKKYQQRCQAVVEKLEEMVDPFDLDVFSPYIQSNLNKQAHRCSVIFGALYCLDKHGQPSSGLRPILTGQEQHNVLPLTTVPHRFPVLPLSSQQSNRSALTTQPLSSQTISRTPDISGPSLTSMVEASLPMTSSQTDLSSSFYDKMEKLGSMGSRIFSNISGKS